MNTTPSSISNLCRCCLKNLNETIAGDQFESIERIILECLSIQLNHHEQFPRQVCQECASAINSIHDIHKRIKTNEAILMGFVTKHINETSIKVEHPSDDEPCSDYKSLGHDDDDDKKRVVPAIDDNSNTNRYRCKTCADKRYFETYLELRAHRRREHPAYKCATCAKMFGEKKLLTAHILNNRCVLSERETDDPAKRYRCEKCAGKRLFDTYRQLHNHRRRDHHAFKCERCDKTFGERKQLVAHVAKCDARDTKRAARQKYACEQCDAAYFATYAEAKNHRRRAHPKHVCNVCGKLFMERRQLVRHGGKCEGDGTTTDLVKVRADGEEDLIDEKEDESSDADDIPTITDLSCSVCRTELPSVSELIRHERRTHRDNVPRRCDICGQLFDAFADLQAHMQKHRIAMFHCEYPLNGARCTRKFARLRHYIEHARSVHGLSADIACPVEGCAKKFVMRIAILSHFDGCHRNLNVNDYDIPRHTCVICGVKTTRLHQHYRVMHAISKSKMVTNIECPRCPNVTFRTPHEYTQHRASMHWKTKVCPHCGLHVRDSWISNHIQMHVKNAADKREFKCDMCEKRFNLRMNLQHHRRTTHTKPVKCPHCDEEYSRGAIRRHIKYRHENQLIHKCSICGRGFVKPENLDRHYLNHNLNKVPTHTCDACDMTFYTPHKLARHRDTKSCKSRRGLG